MSGTLEGGRKAAATNKAKYGKEFYANIGRKGGRNGHTGGFAANPELARIAGAKGGKKSKRGPAKRGGKVLNASYTKDQLERIRSELGWSDDQSTAALSEIDKRVRCMRLRNKKTGGIYEADYMLGINVITELSEDWEVYKPKEPLIKDKRVRKAVRVWAEANNINHNHYYETDVVFDSFEHCLTWIDTSIQFNEITGLENLEDGKKYTIAELCGEEEE